MRLHFVKKKGGADDVNIPSSVGKVQECAIFTAVKNFSVYNRKLNGLQVYETNLHVKLHTCMNICVKPKTVPDPDCGFRITWTFL